MIKQTLTCHKVTPTSLVNQLTVTVSELTEDHIQISYQLNGDLSQLLIPELQAPSASDNLWQHTCFELFIAQADTENYYEFNFSPSTLWAAYAFNSYRVRQEWHIKNAPNLRISQTLNQLQVEATLNLTDLPLLNFNKNWLIGLSAVIKTKHNDLSYWAIKHPEAQPNFHHRDGYIPYTPLT